MQFIPFSAIFATICGKYMMRRFFFRTLVENKKNLHAPTAKKKSDTRRQQKRITRADSKNVARKVMVKIQLEGLPLLLILLIVGFLDSHMSVWPLKFG